MEAFKVYQNSSLDVNQHTELFDGTKDYIPVSDSVKSIEVKIEAARSGRMNDNFVMYTPRAMEQGMKSFIYPFHKHLQSKHNGDAVGVIQGATHTEELFPKASSQFIKIVSDFKKASEASDGKALAKAGRELKASAEYNSVEYKGLGIARVKGVIYDPKTIYELRTKDPLKGQVSIGGKSLETFCSICGNKAKDSHMHKRGRTYAKEVCFYIHNDLQLDHCGFVPIPADSYTNTQLVEDSLQDDLTMNVTKYNKQDNSAERTMNLAALKQKIKDQKAVEALITEYIPDEKQATEAKRIYAESLEDSRPNHFLIGTEQLLNIKTPVGLLVAEKLLEDLEAGSNKEFLKNSFSSALTLKNIESPQAAVDELLKGVDTKKEEGTDEKEKEPETTQTEEVPTTTIESDEIKTPVATDLTESAMAKLTDRIADLVDEKLKSREEATKVEDSLRTEYTKQEIGTLRETLEADQTALKEISTKYRQSLVEQIVLLKQGNVSESYKESLTKRSVDQLQSTIEDLKESLKETPETPVTPPVVPEKNTTEEAVNKVEDQLRDTEIPAQAKENPAEDKTEADTKTDKASDGEAMNVEDGLTPEQAFYADCKTMGLPKAFKKHKQLLSK